MLCLIACDRQVASQPYTETKVEWQGATAEDIANAVRSIVPAPELAVIDDGEAILYHRGSVADTQKELAASAERLPAEFAVSAPVAKEGMLPEVPNQEARVQIRWEVDSAVAADHGITVAEIVSHLREFELKQDEVAAAQALQGKTIKTPSGAEITLNSLVVAKATTVNRPIILNK